MQIPVNEVKIENGRLVYENEVAEQQPVKEEAKPVDPEIERMLADERMAKRIERCIKMAVIGIVASVAAGLGIIFSLIGLIDGIIVRKKDALVSRYAVTLGIIGCVLSVLFAVLVGCVLSILLY